MSLCVSDVRVDALSRPAHTKEMMAVTVLSNHQQAATMSLFHNFKLKMKKAQSSSSLSRCSIKAETALESMDSSHIENSSNSDSPDSGMSSASESGSSGISVTSPPISSPPESPPEHNHFKRERSPPVISPVKTEILKAHLKREHNRAMDWSISPKSARMNQVNLSCERRSPDSPSERSFKIECNRTPSPIMYDGEEHHITSTPMGLGAGPPCERMSPSPPPHSLSPINDSNDHQTQLHNLSVHLHSSSISANPYNMSPSVSASAAIFPVNGFNSNPKQLLVNNGYSNATETNPSPLIFEYHKTVNHARINGIMPELIRGGEIKTNDGKTNVKCHNNTTNQVVLGEAGGFKSMLWVEDNKPREKLGASEPPKTNGNGPQWNGQSSSSTGLSPNQRASVNSDSVFSNGMINNGASVSPVLMRNETDRQNHHSISLIQPENVSSYTTQNGVRPLPLSMEELWEWNGLIQNNPPEVARRQNMPPDPNENKNHHSDEEDKPLICMICDDSATGLHYGIITCEGCKGFFKRTVQNKRIYNCVADGNCEINKQQRNRCQYCRFQKCLRQGMVLAAVREDRMPGGRNSGAVYNLYKVKYKKKNKNKQKDVNKQQNGYPDRGPCTSTSMGHNGTIYPKDMSQHMMDHRLSPQQHYKAPSPASVAAAASSLASLAHHRTSPTSSSSLNLSPLHASALNTAMTLHQVMVSLPNVSPTSTIASNRSVGPSFTPGNILKAALTNPSEVAHFRQCSNKLSSPPPPVIVNKICSYSDAQTAIRELRHYDRFQDCALMKLLPEFDKPEDLSTNHERRNPLIYDESQENPESFFADKVACNHMQWIRQLPFGDDNADHLLTSSCFGLVIFNAVFYLHNKNSHRLTVQHSSESYNNQINIEMSANIAALKKGLQEMSITNGRADNLLQRWIPITEKLSEFTVYLNAARLEESEFLLLKVIMYTMKATPEMTGILEVNRMFKNFLDVYCRVHNQNQPKRVADLLKKTAEILEVSHDLLLEDTSRLKAPFFICDNR